MAVFALPSVALAELKFAGTLPTRTCSLVENADKYCEWFLLEATGGTGDVIYSIESDSEPGFDFDPATRKLSVTGKKSLQTKDGWLIKYKARDDDSSIFGNFRVKINGLPIAHLPANLNLTVGEARPEGQPLAVATGNGDLQLATTVEGWNRPVTGNADFSSVRELKFEVDNERAAGTPTDAYITLSGTPTQPGEYHVTLRLTDGDNEQGPEYTFNIFVNGKPSFGDAQVPNTVFAIGEPGEIALPALTLGNGRQIDHALTWTALPRWLNLNDGDLTAIKLQGTPQAGDEADAKFYEITVTDYEFNSHFGQDSATIRFCFSVGDGAPCEVDFGDASVSDQVWPVGTKIDEITLPETLRTTGDPTYSLSCAEDSPTPCDGTTGLPHGLAFNPAGRTLSGAPTQHGEFAMAYTATDAAGAKKSLNFRIEVDGAPSFPDVRIPNTVFEIGKEVEILLPEVTPGNGAWEDHTLSWSPALPFSWLNFDKADPAALKLSGTAPEGSELFGQAYELTVRDAAVTGQSQGTPPRSGSASAWGPAIPARW